MKRNILRTIAIALLLGAGDLPTAGAVEFDDPNVAALHKSVNETRLKAEKGYPQAQTGMGMINLYGFGGDQDLAAARSWFEKAAGQGYPEAMVQLGNLYENGLGVARDPAKALPLYRQAADLNYPQGRFRLGLLYLGGVGVAKDENEGQKLLAAACENGYRTACGFLMWRENKIDEARAAFNLQCQAGDQLACEFQAQLGPVVAGGEPVQMTRDKGKGGVGLYLIIGMVLVGLLIFWLIRHDPGSEEEKSE